MKTLVIVPTYNEKDNIGLLIPEIISKIPEISVLVVDDSSPDGTAQVVREMSKNNSKINLLLRPAKQGLGKAYLAGFNWALENSFEFIIEMDADFSHRVEDLKQIVDAGHKSADVVVGSRYVKGGGTKNWGIGRKLFSRGGSFYSRCILGYPLNDWTGGFNGWSARALKLMNLSEVKSEGYSFQIELKYRALKKGLIVKEVPILFEERRIGQSKMSSRIVREAFWRVWNLRFHI